MRICLFDIDGTLIASGGAGKAALEAALEAEHGITRALEKLDLSGRTDRAIVTDILRNLALEETDAARQRLLQAYLRHLPSSLRARPGRVLPGIQELLDELSGRSEVALGLLTGNIREGARVKLGHYSLDHYFAFGGFGDDHLDRDDVARAAWRQVEERYGERVRPEDVWVIGDTPLDIRCARAIGARVVAVATGWHPVEELAGHRPDVLVSDLSDPHPFLRRW